MIVELKGVVYEKRLKRLEYTDLELRTKKQDLIQLYKLFKGLEEVDYRERECRTITYTPSCQGNLWE